VSATSTAGSAEVGFEPAGDAALGGGSVWWPIALASGLGVVYVSAAWFFFGHFERLARARATLSLT